MTDLDPTPEETQLSNEELRAREEWVDAYAARYAPVVVGVLAAIAAIAAWRALRD